MRLKIFLLFIFIALCFTARFVGLDRSPMSLNFDEAGLGYNAYSLMLTGKDEFGVSYPLALRSFNDYKPALYAYLTIPFIKLFGLNQTTVRLTSAVFGTISLFFFFPIFKKISKASFITSLLVSMFVAFIPWRLHYSRVAFESNLSMSFFTASVWFLINRQKKLNLVLSIIFALLSIYSYHGARLAVPVLLVLFFFDPFAPKAITNIIINIFKYLFKLWPLYLVILFSLPIFITNNSSSVLRRFDQTNVFKRFYPYTPAELRTEDPWLNLTNNPLYYLGGILTGHVVGLISPRNLALNIYHWVIRSPQGISGGGMIGAFGTLFFIIGLWHVLKNARIRQTYRYLFYWLIAGVAPVAATYEWFHPLRSLNAFPAIDIIVGLGLINLYSRIKSKKLIMIALTGIIIVFSLYNLQNELNYAIYDTNGEFQPGGYKEGALLLMELKDKYQTVYLDSPHAQSYVMFLVYMNYPPQNIQKYAADRPPMGTEGFLNFNFDNFVYQKFDWPADRHNSNFVFWTSAEVKEDEIYATSGATLYKIYDPLGRWVSSVITKE